MDRAAATRRRWVMCLGAAAVSGCVGPPPIARAPPPVWPAPPELPRYIFEATLRNAGSLGDTSTTGQMRRLLSGDESARASFGKPLAVAARRGLVYVTDTEGRRVFVFDVPRRRTFSFGWRLEGELKKPSGIALDAAGRVYVVDTTARRLVIYDGLGLYIADIDGAAQWHRPSAVAVSADASRICVVDTGGVESNSHRVFIYGADYRLTQVLGRRGGVPAEFNLPADAAIGPDGTLWVLDAGNFRVQAFDGEGRFLRMFGSVGNGLGQFARPRGLAVDDQGWVYVSDAAFCNVQVFAPDGQLMLVLGSRAEHDAPGRYLLPARLGADETGRLYVVDQFLHKIEVLRRLNEDEGRRLQAAAAPP